LNYLRLSQKPISETAFFIFSLSSEIFFNREGKLLL
jgi:hypothetical protein